MRRREVETIPRSRRRPRAALRRRRRRLIATGSASRPLNGPKRVGKPPLNRDGVGRLRPLIATGSASRPLIATGSASRPLIATGSASRPLIRNGVGRAAQSALRARPKGRCGWRTRRAERRRAGDNPFSTCAKGCSSTRPCTRHHAAMAPTSRTLSGRRLPIPTTRPTRLTGLHRPPVFESAFGFGNRFPS